MTGEIQINKIGAAAGPLFNLYSDVNGFTLPFETNVSKSDLEKGYATDQIPNSTSIIKVISVGECSTYLEINV